MSWITVVVWCRNQKIYNKRPFASIYNIVVVWCRNQKIYNDMQENEVKNGLWFGVGIKRYTTA